MPHTITPMPDVKIRISNHQTNAAYFVMMKHIIPVLLLVVFFVSSCSQGNSTAAPEGPSVNKDLHPGEGIRIIRTADGLERLIGVFRDEWLGDRYSDPRFECKASSIDRLILFLAQQAGQPIDSIDGSWQLPPGTYSYTFTEKSWKNENEIFDAVLRATEEAFHLTLSLENRDGKRWLIVKESQRH